MDKTKISIISSSLLSCRSSCKGYEHGELIAEAGCSNDVAAVATLPYHWVPRHSGPVLANYLKEREKNHVKVNQDIADQSTDINTRIDAKIRDLVEILLAHIKQNNTDLECVVEHINTGKGPLTSQSRAEALKKVSQLHTKRIEDIAAFRRDATTVERSRADGFRKIMRDQFQRLIAVGHLPPKDLLHDFDDRMYEVNQQLLSNFRAYHELEAQLHSEADEDVIKARSELNQLSLGIAMTHRRRCPRPRSAEDGRISRRSTRNSEKKRVSSVPCITSVLRYSEIEQCVSCLVDAYRKAVLKLFSGFSDKLTDLHKNLTCSNSHQETHLCETSQLQEKIECTIKRLTSSFQINMPNAKEFFEITQSDALSMKKSLFTVGDHLRDTYSILHDAAHLWDLHMMRSALAQKLTMAAVEDLITNNDSLEQANEMNFNVALEQLRTTSEVDKLQPQHDALITMLDRTAEMYLLHCAEEIGRFEEFMNLPQLMANTLLAEYACFLEAHPRAVQVNAALVPFGTDESPCRDIYRRSPLPRAILQTELQVIALTNWRNGFLEAFESNMSLVPVELTRQARQWVDERSAALHMRYSVKMISHSIRMERLKYAHEIRLAELRHHEARLNSHLDAVYNLIASLPEEASSFLALDAPDLYPLSDWVQRIQNDLQTILSTVDIDPEVKRLKMISYSPRLIRYRQLYESSLDEAIQLFKKNVEHRLQEARVSNVRFMSQISLFEENGRYSASEALKASGALLRVADTLESCGHRTVDTLNHRRTQLVGLADQRIAPIQKTVEEFVKISVKSKGPEKKKPSAAKKK